jgi:hypothetical protein
MVSLALVGLNRALQLHHCHVCPAAQLAKSWLIRWALQPQCRFERLTGCCPTMCQATALAEHDPARTTACSVAAPPSFTTCRHAQKACRRLTWSRPWHNARTSMYEPAASHPPLGAGGCSRSLQGTTQHSTSTYLQVHQPATALTTGAARAHVVTQQLMWSTMAPRPRSKTRCCLVP